MTEYDDSAEALEQYLASRNRTLNWVNTHSSSQLQRVSPDVPPSRSPTLASAISAMDDERDDGSQRSNPPNLVMRYNNGRPDEQIYPGQDDGQGNVSGQGGWGSAPNEVGGWDTAQNAENQEQSGGWGDEGGGWGGDQPDGETQGGGWGTAAEGGGWGQSGSRQSSRHIGHDTLEYTSNHSQHNAPVGADGRSQRSSRAPSHAPASRQPSVAGLAPSHHSRTPSHHSVSPLELQTQEAPLQPPPGSNGVAASNHSRHSRASTTRSAPRATPRHGITELPAVPHIPVAGTPSRAPSQAGQASRHSRQASLAGSGGSRINLLDHPTAEGAQPNYAPSQRSHASQGNGDIRHSGLQAILGDGNTGASENRALPSSARSHHSNLPPLDTASVRSRHSQRAPPIAPVAPSQHSNAAPADNRSLRSHRSQAGPDNASVQPANLPPPETRSVRSHRSDQPRAAPTSVHSQPHGSPALPVPAPLGGTANQQTPRSHHPPAIVYVPSENHAPRYQPPEIVPRQEYERRQQSQRSASHSAEAQRQVYGDTHGMAGRYPIVGSTHAEQPIQAHPTEVPRQVHAPGSIAYSQSAPLPPTKTHASASHQARQQAHQHRAKPLDRQVHTYPRASANTAHRRPDSRSAVAGELQQIVTEGRQRQRHATPREHRSTKMPEPAPASRAAVPMTPSTREHASRAIPEPAPATRAVIPPQRSRSLSINEEPRQRAGATAATPQRAPHEDGRPSGTYQFSHVTTAGAPASAAVMNAPSARERGVRSRASSISSASTYYVLASPGQKVEVINIPPEEQLDRNSRHHIRSMASHHSSLAPSPTSTKHSAGMPPFNPEMAPPPEPKPSRPFFSRLLKVHWGSPNNAQRNAATHESPPEFENAGDKFAPQEGDGEGFEEADRGNMLTPMPERGGRGWLGRSIGGSGRKLRRRNTVRE